MKENKKKEKKNSTKKAIRKKENKKVIKKRKEVFSCFLVFLIAFLVELFFYSLFSFLLDRFLGRALFSCFLTFLFSFINSHLRVPVWP